MKCNGAKGGNPGVDHGGHLIGSRFDGAGEQINLVPMTSELNLSKWKSIENQWENYLKSTPAKSFKVNIEVKYENPLKPNRPTRFIVVETIDGIAQGQKKFYK